jgi:hypothetical protein
MSTVVSNSAASVNPDIPVATVTRNGNVYQEMVQGIANQPHDEIVMGYSGSTLTSVTYKLGGVTVATLTLGYTGTNLTSVMRS